MFITGLSVLTLNMFLPSLANIAQAFQADYSIVSLSVAGYLGITALLQLIVGPLSDRFGRRPVLLSCIAVFIVASVGCMLAGKIWSFLAFRMMQGTIIAGGVLPFAIIRDSASEQEAASQMGYVSMAMAVAPMMGPMIGGVLDELFGWRSSFLFFAILGLAALGLCWFDLGETNKNPSKTFRNQFQAYPELLRSRRYWGFTLCITFSVGAFYIFISGVPLIAESIFDISPAMLGFYIGTITAGFMLGSFLSGRYANRYPSTTMMIAGRIVACAGLTAGLTLFVLGFVNVFTMFGATIFVGLGNGLTMPSANSGALSVRPRLAGSASGLKGALAVAGGAVLTSISSAILTERAGAYQLLGLMLICSVVGMLAAPDVRRVNQRRDGTLASTRIR